MQSNRQRLDVDAPAAYRIEVQGRLDESWSSWFDDMAITIESGDGGTIVTVLSGTVADQVALHGVLARVRDLGLPLLSVQHIKQE
jgi:hypothetical protein